MSGEANIRVGYPPNGVKKAALLLMCLRSSPDKDSVFSTGNAVTMEIESAAEAVVSVLPNESPTQSANYRKY